MNSRNSNTSYKLEVIFFLVLFVIVLMVCACSRGAEETAVAKTERQLKGEWQLTKLTVDGVDQTDLFSNLVLTIAAGTYQAENGEPVWPSSGVWNVTDVTTVLRDNGFAINVESITQTKLVLSLIWTRTTFKSGRTGSMSGKHTFEFTKI